MWASTKQPEGASMAWGHKIFTRFHLLLQSYVAAAVDIMESLFTWTCWRNNKYDGHWRIQGVPGGCWNYPRVKILLKWQGLFGKGLNLALFFLIRTPLDKILYHPRWGCWGRRSESFVHEGEHHASLPAAWWWHNGGKWVWPFWATGDRDKLSGCFMEAIPGRNSCMEMHYICSFFEYYVRKNKMYIKSST